MFDLFAPSRARANLNRASAPQTLHVRPLPEEGKPPGEVAVGRFKVSAKLDRAQSMTGDAVTLTARVQGEGNIRTVRLALPALPDVDALQPEVKDLVESPNDLVVGTREYRWLLVPRKPGRTTIPALSLATFDPRLEHYETLKTEPLALEVVGQALAPAASAAPRADDDAQKPEHAQAHRWAPIRTRSELERGYRRWVERPWYGWALLVPPLLWLSVIGIEYARKRRSARSEAGEGRLLREAQQRREAAEGAAQRGEAARFYADASASLLSLLEARVGESVVGLTRVQMRERLKAGDMPQELVDDVTRELEDYEFARFSAGAADAGRLAVQSQTLGALWERVYAFAPGEGGSAA